MTTAERFDEKFSLCLCKIGDKVIAKEDIKQFIEQEKALAVAEEREHLVEKIEKVKSDIKQNEHHEEEWYCDSIRYALYLIDEFLAQLKEDK